MSLSDMTPAIEHPRDTEMRQTKRGRIIWLTPDDAVPDICSSGDILCLAIDFTDTGRAEAWVTRTVESGQRGKLTTVVVVSPSLDQTWKLRETLRRKFTSLGAIFFETRTADKMVASVEKALDGVCRERVCERAGFEVSPEPPLPWDQTVAEEPHHLDLTDEELSVLAGGIKVHRRTVNATVLKY